MFYTLALMLIFAVILLIFDHESRYSQLFVLMSVGAAVAFFFIILQINMFASYGYHIDDSIYYWLDRRIFRWITGAVSIPISANIRMVNVGISLYLLAVTIFNYVFSKELMKTKRPLQRRDYGGVLFPLFLVPLISLILPDPSVSTRMYIIYHLSSRPEWYYGLYRVLEVGYKLLVFYLLFRPAAILLKYVMSASIPFLKRRLLLFTAGLVLMNGIFYSFFYLGSLSVSVEKVIRSGFWIFENVEGRIPKNFLMSASVIFVVFCFCMFILLSFRMDISASPFAGKKIQKNVSIMNEILGETLHSQKNLFFSMQILVDKIEKQVEEPEKITEIRRLKGLVAGSLTRVTQMLDELREIKYQYLNNNLLDIIDDAVGEVHIPEGITLEWDRQAYEDQNTCGMYDKYHMEKALVNVINNAVEAVELSGRAKGQVRIRIDFMLRWIVIMIWDNGTGISRNCRKHIFTPHYSGKHGKMNWGLGLPYVYKVVKAHLGQIRIASKDHEYTSVLLMLPVQIAGKDK